MKKYISLFLILLVTTAAHAQFNQAARAALETTSNAALRKAATVSTDGVLKGLNPASLSTAQLARALRQRVHSSYQEAIDALEDAPYPPLLGAPATYNSFKLPLFPMRGEKVYPDKPFLQKPLVGPFLTESYFLVESNRLFVESIQQQRENFWPSFMDAIPQFYEEAQAMVQPDDSLTWALEQISENTKNLLIGEFHGYHEITSFTGELLKGLREKFPQREIILLTEFLPADQGPSGHLLGSFSSYPYEIYYKELWKKIEELEIQLVGLEPRHVDSDSSTIKFFNGEKIYKTSPWCTLEGMRIRNDFWWNILQQKRAEHPDALFVIYAGNGHLSYSYPFSLGKKLFGPDTYLLGLVPETVEGKNNIQDPQTDPLEYTLPSLDFPQTVLAWKTPRLAELSGYNARIKLPINHRQRNKDWMRATAPVVGIPFPGNNQ